MKSVGIGTRVFNFLVDTALIFLLAFITKKIWDWYVVYYGIIYLNFGWFFFSWLFIYYFLFESFFARTPGKWLTYTKVVNTGGNKPSLLKILIRTLTRLALIDMFLFPFLDKTLHDYLSKTRVIEA